MNFHHLRNLLMPVLVAVGMFGAVQAQTITVDNLTKPNAQVIFRAGTNTIAVCTGDVANCPTTTGGTSPALITSGPPPSPATVGNAYNHIFAASGLGTGPITWTQTGVLPPGLNFSATGSITGSALISGAGNPPYSFSVTATGSGSVASPTYAIAVINPTPPAINSGPPPFLAGNVGTPYNFNFTATGTLPITWSQTGLPAGLTLSASGAISGAPTAAATGPFTLVVTATGLGGATDTRTYSGAISNLPTITPTAPFSRAINQFYSYQFTASQAILANGWAVTTGALPPGMVFDTTTGTLSGTPTTIGPYNFSITAASLNGTSAPLAVSFTVTAAVAASAPAFTSGPPPNGYAGQPYDFTFTATGSPSPDFSIFPAAPAIPVGEVPTGTILSPTGRLFGTNPSIGAYKFAVKATNTLGTGYSPAGPMDWTNASTYHRVIIRPAEIVTSASGETIPFPSKQAVSGPAPAHTGSGAGPILNAWQIDATTRCNNPTAPVTTPPIQRLWFHDLDFDTYARTGSNEEWNLAPNEAYIFRFVPNLSVSGQITVGLLNNIALPGMFMSISTIPCDFNTGKLSRYARDYCYVSVGPADSTSMNVQVGGTPTVTTCNLQPRQVYYFNMRMQNGTSFPAADTCPAGTVCGGRLIISVQ